MHCTFLAGWFTAFIGFPRGPQPPKSGGEITHGISGYNQGHCLGKKSSPDSQARPKDLGKVAPQPSGITRAFLRR